MRSHKLIALIAVCCLLGGTSAMAQDDDAAEESGNQVVEAVRGLANGLANLVCDVIDIASVGITYGSEPGVALEAGLTTLAGAGHTHVTADAIGINGRDGLTWEVESEYSAFRILTVGLGDHPHDSYDIGASVHIGFIGVTFGTNVNRLLDAVSQVVFIDFEGDNVDYF